jgi:hypothetical protein
MPENTTQTISLDTIEKAWQAEKDADQIIGIRVVEHDTMPKFKIVRNKGPLCPGS